LTGTSNAESDKSDVTIKIRMDVDYAYPSRLKSFLYTALGVKGGRSYLKNSKIIAQMVNESKKKVHAYWFFTPTTLPDEEMLALMHNDKHEAALHVARDPYGELARLEKATNQKVKYYTVHGTERLLGRVIWRRKLSQSRVPIPEGFQLKNFWDFPTFALDREAYSRPTAETLKLAEQSVAEGKVLHAHPEWLFKSGGGNHRGPYYEVLRTLLGVEGLGN
jgi:hypothetical protein